MHLYDYTVYGGCVCLGILPQWLSGQQVPGTGVLTSAVPVAQLMLGSGHRLISHTAKKKKKSSVYLTLIGYLMK